MPHMSAPAHESLPRVSIVIPVLNEAERLTRLLPDLLAADEPPELIVVDGGSTDGSGEVVADFPGVTWLTTEPGRGRQQNAGAQVATGDILLFLHADTTLPPGWQQAVRDALTDPRTGLGAFRFVLDSPGWPARLIELAAADIRALCEEHSHFGYEFMRCVAVALGKRLSATRLQLLNLYGDEQLASSAAKEGGGTS